MCKEVGINIPVLITAKVWNRYVELSEGLEEPRGLNGRLWDILFFFNIKAHCAKTKAFQFSFVCELPQDLEYQKNEDKCTQPTLLRGVTLVATLSTDGFDALSPAIFIRLPFEE